MKIAIAQTRPHVGPVESNIGRHLEITESAARLGANLVVFPELSLTGYVTTKADEFSRPQGDPCFQSLQDSSDQNGIAIIAGVPLKTNRLPQISSVIFQPYTTPRVYSKRFLHRDELPFFEPGTNSNSIVHNQPSIALAICYELSIEEHAQHAVDKGASIYIASVAKTESGVSNASERLAKIAGQFSIPVLMSNCLGILDGQLCTGQSAAWNRNGKMVIRLDNKQEGLIVFDSETETASTDLLN